MADSPPSNVVPLRKPLTPEQTRELEDWVERISGESIRPARPDLRIVRPEPPVPRTAEWMVYGSLAAIVALALGRWLIGR